MLKPVVEQRPDKSVNVFLGDLLFKLSPMGHQNRPEWKVSTDHGFEPVSNSRTRRWLNRLWIKKVHCAPRAPGQIPRFPRTPNKQVMKLLDSGRKANNRGDMKEIAKVGEGLTAIASNRPSQPPINYWRDLPLASEAGEQKLKWLAKRRIPLRQVTIIAAAKDTYKTMLMLSLAKAATTDGRFLGGPVRPMPVLYLNRDMPKAVFDAYCRTLRLDKSNPKFRILSSLWDTQIQPMQPDDPVLMRFARRYKPLIVFDYLAKYLEGNMDNPKHIEEFMEKLKQLTVLGATVVVLHHVPKSDETSEGFGSVYIINGADFGWNMTRAGGMYAPEEMTTIKIQNTKTKMGDYFHLKVRPRLKTAGDFEVISEESELKEKWDQAVENFKTLFPTDRWVEKRKARKQAMRQGMSRTKFNQIFTFSAKQGLLRVKNSGRGLKHCQLVGPSPAA